MAGANMCCCHELPTLRADPGPAWTSADDARVCLAAPHQPCPASWVPEDMGVPGAGAWRVGVSWGCRAIGRLQ